MAARRASSKGVTPCRRLRGTLTPIDVTAITMVASEPGAESTPSSAADVARQSNPFSRLLIDGDDRLVVAVIDVGQVAEHRLREVRRRREEPPVARLGAEALERP